MKHLNLKNTIIPVMMIMLVSCNAISDQMKKAKGNVTDKVDGMTDTLYLTKPEKIENILTSLKKASSENVKINQLIIDHAPLNYITIARIQSKENANKMVEITNRGSGFGEEKPLEIQVRTGKAEDFNINNSLFSITDLDAKKIAQCVKEAMNKTTATTTDANVSQLRLELDRMTNDKVINVFTEGHLKNNEILKKYTYKASLQGNFISFK